MKPVRWLIFPLIFTGLCIPAGAQTKSTVVEEIVARVNNEIITREDLEHARAALEGEVRDGCANCSDEKIRSEIAAKDKDLLRDLIDQSLLAQRAKDTGINVDTEVIKRLDAIRQQYKLPTMEALEAEVTKSGQDYEDFKAQLRDQLLTQELIRKEVGSKIIVSHEDVVKYYNEHKNDFVRPETVVLREFFVSTEGKPEADLPALKKKAETMRDRVMNNGDDFGELAKHYSDSSTAQQSGELGTFQRSQLDPKIADKVFALNRNQMTEVFETKTGFEILQVQERYQAGEQPLDKVEPEISNKLYEVNMEPAMRAYLKTLREDSYVQIKPGYTDTAAVKAEPIEEVAATPDNKDDGKSKSPKKLGIFPKKKSGT
ncbi:MAG TPA: peptidylprolyl isomerase [Candidatus Sulfotelmatobacter sp.]|jgi:peptidyl-prolyl cis-trans isomerase SurA|nr:peptidylprolyl isomerase [Candidatus Sulfotelmatobacter sp.]